MSRGRFRCSPPPTISSPAPEKHAERLEWEADFAIDYAIASIEQAGFAAIDAIAGRVKAEQVKGAR